MLVKPIKCTVLRAYQIVAFGFLEGAINVGAKDR